MKRLRDRNAQESEGGANKVLDEERMESASGVTSVGGAGLAGWIGEVPQPPGERRTPWRGEGGARDKIRTAMEGMEV